MRRASAAAALVSLLAGCTVGPDYKEPPVTVSTAYVEPRPAATADAPTPDLSAWWTLFGDPELDRLVAIALSEGIDIKVAASRIRQARLGVIQARAAGLPTLGASATGQHSDTKDTAHLHRGAIQEAIGGLGLAPPAGTTLPKTIDLPETNTDTYSAGFDASWELDIFGATRRSVEAARARVDAAVWSERDAQVTLAAEVANAYLDLRLAQDREGVARAELARQTRELQIEGNTAKVGLVPQGDFSRQRAQLASTEASLPPLIAEQHAQAHALAVLLACPPEQLEAEILVPRPWLGTPPTVPPGLPSALLRRRPDIRAAERNLAAATADIGVAVADLYPRFSLTAAAQLMSTAYGGFLTLTGRTLSASGAFQFPILDFGRRRATVDIRREDAAQAYLRYQATVLGAFRDVEDALARVDSERQRNVALRAGLADATRAVQATAARYRVGLIDQTTLLDAQQSILTARDGLAQSDGMLRQDLVALYKALGGGWADTAPAPTIFPAKAPEPSAP